MVRIVLMLLVLMMLRCTDMMSDPVEAFEMVDQGNASYISIPH